MAESESWILMYEYVDGMAEKRTPFRSEHLARIVAEREAGKLFVAGAVGEAPVGGAFGFSGVDRGYVEAFAQGDPYQINGLIVRHTIDSWKLV